MNLIEAIKSGKPFRRKGGEDWLLYTNGLQWPSHGGNRAPNSTEMFADDWEIQEQAVTITRSQFWEAYASGLNDWASKYKVPIPGTWATQDLVDVIRTMAKKFGLE